MVPKGFDLHVHSTASDGSLSPSELVSKAMDLQLNGIALTDHDSLTGLSEFMSVRAADSFHRIPGIELTVQYQSARAHLLGYYVSDRNGVVTLLLNRQIEMHEQRVLEIISKLQGSGMALPLDGLRRGQKPSISFILDSLVKEGYSDTAEQAKADYLKEGGPGYVRKEYLDINNVIDALLSDGAVPVLAHPLTMRIPDVRKCLEMLTEYGLLGVEAYYDYTHHGVTSQADIEEIGRELGLILTGGTDYHSDESSPPLGSISVGYETIDGIQKSRKEIQ